MLARLLALALLESALADVYTYPVKSINLGSAMAPAWYEGMDPTTQYGPVTDFHPVHGTTASDGGSVLVGKAIESENTGTKEGFALKFSSSGSSVWGWTSSSSGEDAANAVLELSGGDLLVAGYRTVSGVAKRSLTKLSASGSEVWTGTSFGDGSGSHGAWEMISATSDGILLAGLKSKASGDEMLFKSYGNAPGGSAVVMKLPTSSVGSSAPTSSMADWTQSFSSYETMKAARALSNGNVACLMWGEEKQAGVVMLSSSGATIWGPIDYHTAHGEATDLQVSADGSSLFLSGQGPENGAGYYGRLTKIDASDGSRAWTKSYTAGGNPNLIYNECWGVTVMSDGGLTLACGTGIENCPNTLSSSDLSDCQQGLGDTRANAIARGAGVWQTLIIRTDSSGELLWQRVDSYRASGSPALASATSDDLSSSAAEWAFLTSGGDLIVVTDEVFGVGLMKLTGGSSSPSGGGEVVGGEVTTTTTTAGGLVDLGQRMTSVSAFWLLLSFIGACA